MPQLLIGSTETGDLPACVITLPDERPDEQTVETIAAAVADIWEQQTPEGSERAWVASDDDRLADAVAKRYKVTRRPVGQVPIAAPAKSQRPERPKRPAQAAR